MSASSVPFKFASRISEPLTIPCQVYNLVLTFSVSGLGQKRPYRLVYSPQTAKLMFRRNCAEFLKFSESSAPAGVTRSEVQTVPRDAERLSSIMRTMNDYVEGNPPMCPVCKSERAFCMPICGHPLCLACKESLACAHLGGATCCPTCSSSLKPLDWLNIDAKESPNSSIDDADDFLPT